MVAVAKHDANTLNGLIRAIAGRHFHANNEEITDGSKFLSERFEASQKNNDRNGIIAWGGLKKAFDIVTEKIASGDYERGRSFDSLSSLIFGRR